MPLCFAYGANMDRAAMERRCASARSLGVGRIARHRFFVTADGYASIMRDARQSVHGVVWNLTAPDIAALDRFEAVDRGLYRKRMMPVLMGKGRSVRALVYVASNATLGEPFRGYIEAVLDAARQWNLPAAHLAQIAACAAKGEGRPGARFENVSVVTPSASRSPNRS